MCFSAIASFSAAGALFLLGGGALYVFAAKLPAPQRPYYFFFAILPILFAMQQATEGFLWLTFDGDLDWDEKTLVTVFLFFALILWPSYIPLTLWSLQARPDPMATPSDAQQKPKQRTKRCIGIKMHLAHAFMLIIGLCVSAFLCMSMVETDPSGKEDGHHIQYSVKIWFDLGDFRPYATFLYVFATVAPFALMKSCKPMFPFGVLMMASFLITLYFYEEYLTSVWCFFAGVLSGCVILIIAIMTKKDKGTQSRRFLRKSSFSVLYV